MRVPGRWRPRHRGKRATPLDAASVRLLVAASIGVLIWMIWVTGMLGDSQRVTMLSLSAVSLLGLGLVLELRRRCVAEEMARESERRYRFLADHSFDMIVRLDPSDRRRLYVSPACRRLYGYEPEELVGQPIEDLMHPEDLAAVHAALATLEHSEVRPVRYRALRKDGSHIWVEASLSRSTNPASGEPEIVAVVRDVSERIRDELALRQARDEANSANRSKSQFLATMSHELRTPLNSIIGFTEIIQTELMGPLNNEQYKTYISDIHLSSIHLLQLINDILDLTKAEAGMLELSEEPVDLRSAVEAIVRLCRASIEKAALTVAVDLPEALPQILADERKVRQVLFNLVGNAVKFTPAGGHIAISARVDARAGIEIIVADTGIGIAQGDVERVLEPFVQVDSPLTRQHQGSGLGLPAVKVMMELHGGRLQLTSAIGAGTQATVVFPAARMRERAAATSAAA